VSGTNGKTTTTAMVAAGWGGDVATNETGSNMPAGHTAALVATSHERVVLETDERWLGDVVSATSPRIVTLLNLSRDQLDRASEVRQIAERWRQTLRTYEGVVVANANDPLVVYAAELSSHVLWCDVVTPWRSDAVSCPHCTRALDFSSTSWSSTCGFAKPLSLTTTTLPSLVVDGVVVSLQLQMPGAFNESNAAMALTVVSALQVDLGAAAQRMNALSSVADRFALRRLGGQQIRMLLAKNPAGFAALLATLGRENDDVWIAINARVADGRDPSWLYDVPFEVLRGRRVWCFGERRLDLATRLEYAGVDFTVAANDEPPPPTMGVVSLLANYTAFQDWRQRTTA